MLRNQLLVAWRSLMRNKAFATINVVGLAIGLTVCLLISLFVLDELSYDRFNDKADQIVRVIFRGTIQGGSINEAMVMAPTAQTLKAEFPEVLDATRLSQTGAMLFTYQNKTFKEHAVAFVDANFSDVFSLPFLKGNPKTALLQPNTAVVDQATAHKYFGDADPIGKVLTIKGESTTYTITGLIDAIPTNAHFQASLLLSMASRPDAKSPSWMISGFYTYLVLPQHYDYKRLEAKLPQVVEKYMAPQLKQAFGMSMAQFRQKGNDVGLYLQPLTDIHLHSNLTGELLPNGTIQYVYLFGAIALFMLLIACINFMNLSTAGASKRAKEVGIRKVMGSERQGLVQQFLIESMLLTSLSLVLAIGLLYLSLPFFNELAGKQLTLSFSKTPWLLPALLGVGILVGTLAGSYPAFFLSSFKPITVLKGRTAFNQTNKSGLGLRSGLVVFQFFVSILLTIGTIVVYQQLTYIQQKKLGYSREQVLILPEAWRLGRNVDILKNQMQQDARVLSASVSPFLPAGPSNSNNFIVYADNRDGQLTKTLCYEVDDQYMPTLGMKLLAGRNFSADFGTDSTAIVLNETAAKTFGWGKQAIGHTLTRPQNDGAKVTYRVIGIVEDFHFRSLHERIAPLVMTLGKTGGFLIVKTKSQDVTGLLDVLKRQWTILLPDEPFVYSFLDESFNATYRAEQRTGQIVGIFAGLTIFIACLGLFGLATFTAEQRTKEIGVRKVLGASVFSIVGLLSKDFLKLVLVAIVIASPIAYYAMHRWLQDFAYRVDINWWVFALAGLPAVGIALLTVSFQSVKAALVNPVKSLRSE
jgi:putative ABC transport system permease protein